MNQCQSSAFPNSGPYFLNGYGALDAFYSIASGAIDNVQSVISDQKKRSLYMGMGMGYLPLPSGDSNSNIIDATTNQAGLYVLQGIGFVIFFVMLLVAIFFTGCIRCCRKCGRKSYQSKPSKLGQLISFGFQFLVYLTSFAFILTGIIIFGESVNNFNSSIDGGNQQMTREKQSQSGVLAENGRNLLWCSYNNTIIDGLAGIPNETTLGTQKILDDWWTLSGLRGLNWDYQNITDSVLSDTQEFGKTAIAALQTLSKNPKLQGADAQKEITDMIAQITASNSLMQQIRDYIPTTETETLRVLTAGNQTANSMNYDINYINVPMLARLSAAQNYVGTTTQSVADAGAESSRVSQALWVTMYSKMSNAFWWGGYGPIKGTAVGLITGTGVFALIFILLGMLICLYYFIEIFIPITKCGEHGRVGAHVLRGGSYAMMWLSFASIIVSGSLLWYSQLYAGTCYNMYNTNNRQQFYNAIHDEYLTTTDFTNSRRAISYGIFLDSLETRPTVWSALSGAQTSPLLTTYQFTNYVNVNGTYSHVLSYLWNANLNAGFSTIIAKQFHIYAPQLNQTTATFDYLRDNNLFLPICSSIAPGPTFGVQQDLISYSMNLDFVSKNVNDLDASFQLASSYTQSSTLIQLNTDATNTYMGQIQPVILGAVSNFLNLVDYSVYMSSPVYYDYANSGYLLCSAIRSPLNGTWASAGMIALFWIPASICLWFTSNLLYRLHKRKPNHVYPEQPVCPQPVVETPVVMSTTIMAPARPPAPVVVVPTNFPLATPVAVVESPPTASAATPAMYPIIPDDSLVIIEGL